MFRTFLIRSREELTLLYVGAMVNIDPDDRELLVGPFDDAISRALWANDTAPAIARTLNIRLDLGEKGIELRTWFVDSLGVALEAIRPDQFIHVIQNIYRDVYQTA